MAGCLVRGGRCKQGKNNCQQGKNGGHDVPPPPHVDYAQWRSRGLSARSRPKGVSAVAFRSSTAFVKAITPLLTILALLPAAQLFAQSNSAAGPGPIPVLTLDICVEQAMRAAPEVLLSRSNLEAAEAARDQTAAKNAFGLSGAASASHGESSSVLSQSSQKAVAGIATMTVPTDTLHSALSASAPLSTTFGLSADQIVNETSLAQATKLALSGNSTLWDGYPGGRDLATLRQADFDLGAKRQADDAARLQLAYEVKQAYFTLLGNQNQTALLGQTLAARQGDELRVKALFAVGQASRIDVEQAAVNRRQTELDLAKAKDGLGLARRKLSMLVGWDPDKEYSVAPASDPEPPDLDLASAVKRALDRRPDFLQMSFEMSSNRIGVDLTRSLFSPVLTLNGNYSLANDWQTMTLATNWSLGLQVNVPIIDAGSLRAQARQASAQATALALQRDQLASTIDLDVRTAWLALRDLKDRVGLAMDTVALAKDQYDLANTQFELGTGTSQALLTASVALSTAEAGLEQAKNNLTLGILALQNAMGE